MEYLRLLADTTAARIAYGQISNATFIAPYQAALRETVLAEMGPDNSVDEVYVRYLEYRGFPEGADVPALRQNAETYFDFFYARAACPLERPAVWEIEFHGQIAQDGVFLPPETTTIRVEGPTCTWPAFPQPGTSSDNHLIDNLLIQPAAFVLELDRDQLVWRQSICGSRHETDPQAERLEAMLECSEVQNGSCLNWK